MLRSDTEFSSLVTEEALQPPEAAEGNLSRALVDAFMSIWARRAFVLKVTLGAGIIALILALVLPKQYQSTTRLMPPEKNHGNLAAFAKLLDQNMGALAAEAMGAQMSGALYVQVLGSRTVQDDIVQKFDLRRVYGKKLWKDARMELARNTDISEDRKSGIIGITVTAKSPQLAAGIAGRYVEALNELMQHLDASAAHREREFIEGRIKEVKVDLDHDSLLLSQFSTKNETLDPKEQGKTMVEAAAKLQGELIAAQAELSGIRQIYGPQNAKVRAAESRIGELRRDLQSLHGGSGDQDLEYPSIRKLPAIGLQYTDLYRNVKIHEAVFESLTKQFEMAKVEEARDVPLVRVLDQADVPEVKSRPRRTFTVLLGLFLGAIFSAGYVLIVDYWRGMAEEAPAKKFTLRLCNDVLDDAVRLGLVRHRPVADQPIEHPVAAIHKEQAAGKR